jgi:hypothetical protein
LTMGRVDMSASPDWDVRPAELVTLMETLYRPPRTTFERTALPATVAEVDVGIDTGTESVPLDAAHWAAREGEGAGLP